MAFVDTTFARSRRQSNGRRSNLGRRIRFFEQLEDRRVLAVTWTVQSDYFGERNVISQARSLRGMTLSGDEAHVYTGFIQGSSSPAIREVSSAIVPTLIGNGGPAAPHPSNPVYATGLEASLALSSNVQPRGLAGDERGFLVTTLSSSGSSNSQPWAIYSENLGSQLSARLSTNANPSTIRGMATAKFGDDYFVYVGWANGLIERWNVNDETNPVLDTDWGAAGTPGKINLRTFDSDALLNGLTVDTDGTIFVAGGLNGSGVGDALIKIPASAGATGDLDTVTSVAVQGGANGLGGPAAMDVALYAGKAYVTQYLALNSTISVFYTLDLSSAGNITPPVGSLAGPSGKVSEYNSDAGTDSGFSGIDISADGRIYLAEQLYNFVPASGSYTPPGGNAMTGTRIYFDRVIVSTALDIEGPVTSAVVASPNPATAGAATLITLTATINDASASGSTIAVAEYSVDGGATWLPLAAADGVFDEVAEDATATFTLGSANFAAPGSYTIYVRGTDTAGQIGAAVSTTLEVEGVAPTITTADTATFLVGTLGVFDAVASGEPTPSFSFTGTLPDGISFVNYGDVLTFVGTPAAGSGGSYSLTLTASNGVDPDAVQNFTLVVNEAPTITSADSTTFTVNSPGTFTVTTSDHYPENADLNVTGTLPSGVSFVDNGNGTATLSGVPAVGTQGIYNLTITASNGVGVDATQAFTLTVNPPPIDFGDAPDSYGTLLASNGARHNATGPTLGAARDVEADGQPGVAANGDGADEDGVVLPTALVARMSAEFTITASAAGRLDAWIDFNRNGVFDASEQVFGGANLTAGPNVISIDMPTSLVAGPSYARFRLSSTGGLSPTGLAADGEVEDYPVNLVVPALGSIQVIDDPESPGSNVLVIRGTNYFYETISVQPTAGQPGKVTASISPGTAVAGIDLASFDRIVIFGEGGLDSITVAGSITKPSTIYGDAGFDTINGGGGPDIIYGGADYDSLNGNGGDDVIINEGGADSVNGGAGFDTIVKSGSGTFNLSNYLIYVGSDFVSISSIESATLIGGPGSDVFNMAGWTGSATVYGGGGTNVLADTADGNFVLQPNQLTRTVGSTTTTIAFEDIQSANLTGGFGNNSFDLSAWSGAAVLNGGYFGTDSVIVAGDVNYTLSDVMLLRPSFGMIRLSGFENATLSGGASDNTFNLVNWSNAATVNGQGGTDKLVAAGNVNFTLSDTSLTRSSGGAFTLSSIEQAELTGGAGNNTISAAAFTGEVKIDGAGGNDILTAGAGLALLLGSAGNDTLNGGNGRSVMIGGDGVDSLDGGGGDDLLVDGTTVHDNSAAALALILAEWASASSYSDRVAHLTGTAGGLNGSTHLGGNNVIHDGAVDSLFGGSDDDLFFAKLTAPALDVLGDKTPAESAI